MVSPPPPEQFEFAMGQATVRDGDLFLDRTDPKTMGRLETFRRGIATNLANRPWRTWLSIAFGILLVAVFLVLVGLLYLGNPSLVPLLGLLAVLFTLAVVGPWEWQYRRSTREREHRRERLAEEFDLVRPDRIPLDDIVRVTERQVSTGRTLPDGDLLFVHFEDDGETRTTYLGFPSALAAEKKTARAVFEDHGIPVSEEA